MKPAPRILFDLAEEKGEYKRMELMLALYRPRPEVDKGIREAYDTSRWDWRKSDGCSLVSEAHSPKGMKFPVCVAHDYECWKARRAKTFKEAWRIRLKGDKLFFWGNIDFRRSWFFAARRYVGVRIGWYFWGMWKVL